MFADVQCVLFINAIPGEVAAALNARHVICLSIITNLAQIATGHLV